MAVITVCRYSLKSLAELKPNFVSDEHVIPHALGGPDALSVRADIDANSTLGSSVDSALIHDPPLRLMAALKGVRSRSGEVSIEVPATVVGTGDQIGITFDKNGMGRRRILQPQRRDPDTGAITVRGFDGQFDEAVDRVTRGMSRKGKTVQSSNHQIIQNPCVHMEIPSDEFGVNRGLVKIAYLALFRALGDPFVRGPDGARFRAVFGAPDWVAYEACQLDYLPPEIPILPPCEEHEHLLACYRAGPMILTTIKLFGGARSVTFAIAAHRYPVRDIDGGVTLVDSVKRQHRDLGLREAMPPIEIARRLNKFAAELLARRELNTCAIPLR